LAGRFFVDLPLFLAAPAGRRLGFAGRLETDFLAAAFLGAAFGFFLARAGAGETFFGAFFFLATTREAELAADRFAVGLTTRLLLFLAGGAGLAIRAAFALVDEADDSALRREVAPVAGGAASGRFELRAESLARLRGPVSRVARAPSRRPATSASSGRPSSARLKPVMLLPGVAGCRRVCACASRCSRVARSATRANRPPTGKTSSFTFASSSSLRMSAKPLPWSFGLCASEPTAMPTPRALALRISLAFASRYFFYWSSG
jgi:hypothetical protein